ncbi:hypothetical protein CEXT_519761 [Caerostris extrusa]|uniref:Uncharacterized protein n=1 Tax=Caerostris extrusa TaxID=172846 RepID=A0AAV4YED0_CAEEX|nr:hypothetical protein CEXT_519761 [Caerostris extrusa]
MTVTHTNSENPVFQLVYIAAERATGFESYQVVKPKNSAHAFVGIPLKTELRAVQGIIHRPGNSLNNRSLGSPPEQPNRTEKNRTRFYLYKARKSFFKILEA